MFGGFWRFLDDLGGFGRLLAAKGGPEALRRHPSSQERSGRPALILPGPIYVDLGSIWGVVWALKRCLFRDLFWTPFRKRLGPVSGPFRSSFGSLWA